MKSKEVRGLMEAYNAVYAPQELTEEQIWEQVENWVNSLLEEGYDLSEYTWEEMYEAYLNEKMGNIPPTTKNSPYNIRNLGASQFAAYKLGGGDAAMSQGKGTAAEIIARGRKAVKSFDGGSRIPPTKPKVTPPSPPVKPAPTATAKPTPKPVPAQKPAPMRDEPLWDSNPKPVPGPNVKPNPTAPAATTPPAAAAPAPAPAPTKRFDIRDRDPRARGGFDPRFDKKPVAQMLQAKEPYQPAKPPVSVQRATPATPAAAPNKSAGESPSTSAPKPSPGGSTSPSAPKPGGGGGLLGSLDKFARDTAGRLGGEVGAQRGRETAGNIFGIPEKIGRNKGTQQGQQMYDKAKETLGGFLKQDYESEGEVVDEAMSSYDRNRKRAAQRAADRNAARDRGQTGNVPGVGYVSPRRERETYTDESGQERHKSGARMPKKEDQKESFDLFDYLLEYLVAEGYADTNKAALAIMANMSEEWKQSIIEDVDAQGNRSHDLFTDKPNPKYKPQPKKPAPTSGHSTRPGDGKPYADGPLF